MPEIQRICNIEFIRATLREGTEVDELIEALVRKAQEEAENVETLEALEGEVIQDDDELRILKECPMVSLLGLVKKETLARTGKDELPGFYKEIVQRYSERNPDDAAILHPLCIFHQVMRDVIGARNGKLTRQVACRSGESGKVVISENGRLLANLTEDRIREKIDGYACLYMQRPLYELSALLAGKKQRDSW